MKDKLINFTLTAKLFFRNFTSFLSKKYGNCFTFNSGYDGSILKLEKSGALYGRLCILKTGYTQFTSRKLKDEYVLADLLPILLI